MTAFWKDKRVLVTGANGFVGAWVARELVGLDASVTALVRDTVPGGLRLHGLEGEVASVRGDLSDAALLARVLNEYDIDTVFHLAAQSLVPIAARDPVSTFESNIRGTWTVLERCRLADKVRRIVVSTSDKVYGNQDSDRSAEDAPLRGLGSYEASKVCADVIAQSYATSFGLPLVVVRCANVYGGGDLNYSRIVPYAIRNVLLRRPIVLRSDGSHCREYLYVEDAVSGFLAAAVNLDRVDARGEAFNLGTSEPTDVLALVQRIARLAGADEHPILIEQAPAVGEIPKQSLDSSKAMRVLAWRAETPLDTGLHQTIHWYRRHLRV